MNVLEDKNADEVPFDRSKLAATLPSRVRPRLVQAAQTSAAAMDFYRQTSALADKTLRIILQRHFTSTLYSALILPAIASLYLGVGQRLTNPNSEFGIAEPRGIRSLGDALSAASGDRDTVVFINNGFTDGEIGRVISSASSAVTDAGKNATTLERESDISYVCKSSFRGTSNCFGAVVFHSSPEEGDGNLWNYTIRADPALGGSFRYNKDDNDAETYVIPLQRAIDAAIAGGNNPLGDTQQFAFTAETEDEREARLRRDYQSSFINFLSVAFLVAFIGVCYHMPGFMATERERGLSQLIDAMMPARYGWERQIARLLSSHYAFTMVYMPGWIVAAVICRAMIWKYTSYGIIIPFFVLAGLSMTSMALLVGSFFRKSQLSGAISIIIWIVLGIVAQFLKNAGAGPVIALSLLFTPCNFVFFIVYMARYERDGIPADLSKAPAGSPYDLPGVIFWVFCIIQTVLYPIIGAYCERKFHGVNTGIRGALSSGKTPGMGTQETVRIENMTKVYKSSILRRMFSFVSPPRPEVVAVNNLTLSAKKGQILALLGANGSGKSTTLDAIAGISNFTSGTMSIDTSGGLGIAPQKNVLWDELTVLEHITLFNKLKCPGNPSSAEENRALINAIGLGSKMKAQSKTLSGGQKRKLQLGMMLTGGSAVCCVDEVSSGIDPLSRRKIWDILLSERGSRTIIMTTHFLDEADLLADNIAILSKGKLCAEGSSAELKDRLGAGYRIHVLDVRHVTSSPNIHGVEKKVGSNTITYIAPSPSLAAEVVRNLEAAEIRYQFSGPTIEDVFLHVAEEIQGEDGLRPGEAATSAPFSKERSGASDETQLHNTATREALGLRSGKQISFPQQTWVLLRKRFVIFKTNWIPYVAAFIIPVVAAAVTQLLVRNKEASGCLPSQRNSDFLNDEYNGLVDSLFLVSGPSSEFGDSTLENLLRPLLPPTGGNGGSGSLPSENFTLVNSLPDFRSFVEERRREVSPGGWFLGGSGSPPTVAYKADKSAIITSVIMQNLMNSMLTNTTIATSYRPFASAAAPSTGQALQLVVYLGLAFIAFPSLFGFYPNTERKQNVRSLQYSSGARSLPLWAAHLTFDFTIILVAMCISAGIYLGTSDIWYNGGFLILIFILYGLASILLSYLVSLFAGSALSTFAGITAIQGVGSAVYIISFLFIVTFSSASSVDKNILIAHWIVAALFPIGSLLRTLLVALNVFSTTCTGDSLQPNPAAMTAYGGPILYLIIQSIILFSLLLWYDSGSANYATENANASADSNDPELANELVRVTGPGEDTDGLRVVHLTKAFGKFTAVDNVSFGVEHGEVFALLGPNGAGKSTTISMIRGDLPPSRHGGDVFVENNSVTKNRAAARQNLGVCPQFDAIDSMTVREHLEHYARIRGIADVHEQVQAVIRAVGLEAYTDVMAHTLSGGNKRKLSLGIALTGNPSVILLDEPSSGLDAAAKRIMWRTLGTIVPGRSILLTTHSMEEADALANRAGILAHRMLALGTTEKLRHRFGDTLHVHLISRTAPHSTTEEMDRLLQWVMNTFPGAKVEQETFHGQMRFSVPASSIPNSNLAQRSNGSASNASSPLGQLLVILEENKNALGIAHHSVSPTTLNQVFLTIVGKHDVQEEGYKQDNSSKPWWKKSLFL
ncbi:ABC transporter A family member 2 [Paramyrothecium foliicola]|nr:ABC transporter A family member 2 [Paramyrothecium foliicola]